MMIKSIVVLLALLLCSCIQTINSQVITASPDVLSTSGDFVELKWTGVQSPTSKDLIGIYYPPDANPLQPIGFVLMSNSTSWKQGTGSVTLPLVNVRQQYVFRIWTQSNVSNGLPQLKIKGITYSTVAMSNNVTFANLNEPGKVYISLTNVTSEMRVMFISGTDDTPVVNYGLSPNQLNSTATGITVTYTINQMCASPANNSDYFKDPGFIHDVVITGLAPSTQYFYQVGSESSGYSQKTYSFISAPELGTEAYVVAFGDLGLQPPFIGYLEVQPPAALTVANVYTTVSSPFSVSPFTKKLGLERVDGGNAPPPWNVHHIGDISYARGHAFVWDYYHDMIEEVTSMSSYMVSIGNHEYDFLGQPFRPSWSDYGTDSGGECGVPYNTRYHMTGGDDLPSRNLWYSYNYGPIHFTVMSMEHDFLEGSQQYNWLVQDLASVDRSVTPWLIVSGHRPFYGSSNPGLEIGMYEHLSDTYEPLFVQYDVNLALVGHVHIYERTCGMYNFTCAGNDNLAPVYITIGMAGNTYQGTFDGSDIDNGSGHEMQPNWSVFRALAQYGYTRFYANQTDLYFEFVGNARNQVHDSLWLQSKYAGLDW